MLEFLLCVSVCVYVDVTVNMWWLFRVKFTPSYSFVWTDVILKQVKRDWIQLVVSIIIVLMILWLSPESPTEQLRPFYFVCVSKWLCCYCYSWCYCCFCCWRRFWCKNLLLYFNKCIFIGSTDAVFCCHGETFVRQVYTISR